ncbi:ParB/RepB/Spo0J family partition protein [Desulfoscipio geothermicus]|uniref:Chromosome partitioning protein, ParB family n=1 Tax=Desulfoscipio geothermicus DSM 3669 TaxID=1121426 RepID=A0A1I6E460_9FIRM|nr:ParB/RepB/Spo0J family partition protein [Desulfoscipio geothermicus]SFR12549.1 chromosome partitioning protein, ParB family [Desulfoscipio geothermicus DSM 3669]
MNQGRTGLVVDLFLSDENTKGTVRYQEIKLEKIHPNISQPRKDFNQAKINELAASIKSRGLLQPIRVRPVDGGRYEIIAGERRWRASKLAGLDKIPCVITSNLTEEQVMLEALVENLQRENLTALEKSRGIEYLINDCNRTVTDVANSLGISRMQVYRYLNILKLPEHMLETFFEANLNEMHARALLLLNRRPDLQKELFQRIKEEKISGQDAVRAAEQMLANLPVETPLTKTVNRLHKRLSNLEKKLNKLNTNEKDICRQEIISLRNTLDEILTKF